MLRRAEITVCSKGKRNIIFCREAHKVQEANTEGFGKSLRLSRYIRPLPFQKAISIKSDERHAQTSWAA